MSQALCPLLRVQRQPNYASSSPQNFQLLEVLSEVRAEHGYEAHLTCRCQICGHIFLVQEKANPYYATYQWPWPDTCGYPEEGED